MNILFTRFPLESRFGGAEVQTLSLIDGLQQAGHGVTFVGSCPILLKALKNVHTLDIGEPPVTKWNAITFFWRKSAMRKKLLDAIDALPQKPDAIFMLSISEKLLVTTDLAERGIHVFWVEHDRVGRWLTKNPWLSTLLDNARHATTIVVSELSKSVYENLGWPRDRLIAIPNGIDPKRLKNVERKNADDALRIGCIARLTVDKGVDVLIDAVTDLPEVDVQIVGDGPEEGYLQKLIVDRNLSNRVHITGNVDDVSTIYSTIDILVLPSRDHDPFGLVAAEAMMLGIPTIVTDQCGIADYVMNTKDALVVPAESSRALRNAISQLVELESMRRIIGENGQATARKEFTIEKMMERYTSLLSF